MNPPPWNSVTASRILANQAALTGRIRNTLKVPKDISASQNRSWPKTYLSLCLSRILKQSHFFGHEDLPLPYTGAAVAYGFNSVACKAHLYLNALAQFPLKWRRDSNYSWQGVVYSGAESGVGSLCGAGGLPVGTGCQQISQRAFVTHWKNLNTWINILLFLFLNKRELTRRHSCLWCASSRTRHQLNSLVYRRHASPQSWRIYACQLCF